MTVWRLQTNTDSKTGYKIADYCIENNVLAMGWSLKDGHLEWLSNDLFSQALADRSNIASFQDYSDFIKKYNVYGGKVNSNVSRFFHEVQENDMVWIRSGGVYYLGRVTNESRWEYNKSQISFDLDASNQITNIEWHKIGDEGDVPGAITTAMIRGQTLQRINKDGVWEYSQLVYNEKSKTKYYSDFQLEKSYKTFYNLLSPDDCEDLLCLWLYAKFGYVVIPSTNKKATECYECVLKNPKTGQSIYPQVKAGNVDLHKENYAHLNGEVWLFTTRGRVMGEDINNNIHVADPKTIYDFVGSDIANKILSPSILLWYHKLNEA